VTGATSSRVSAFRKAATQGCSLDFGGRGGISRKIDELNGALFWGCSEDRKPQSMKGITPNLMSHLVPLLEFNPFTFVGGRLNRAA
jgi:hypothetical protein